MKGDIQGLKISQVSLILIGLVCVSVLAFAWAKTTLLTSFVPAQSRVPQLDLDIPASLIGRTTPEERNNQSKQAEIMPENSLALESPIRSGQTGNLSATIGKKEIPPSALERLGSGDHPAGKNELGHEEIVLEKSVKTEQTTNLSTVTGKQDCNYARGKWVFDDNRPLYSGSGCKQWLSSMWACRLTQRTDFEYEKLRWQPEGCKMEDFTGSKFLQRWETTGTQTEQRMSEHARRRRGSDSRPHAKERHWTTPID